MKVNDSKLLRNLGFDEEFFQKIDKYNRVYVIKREKIRKVVSESAITKIESEILNKNCREAEDLELYKDCVQNDYLENEKYEDNERYIREEDVEKIDSPSKFYEVNELVLDDCKIENNLEIFKNCSEIQINKLKNICKNMNSSKEERVLVKAYKSKLKTKFYKIYEENSLEFKEKVKYKIFHKCNYPSCGRTFASAGWLRSHFIEHMKDIKKNKFNILFENLIENFKNKYFNIAN